MGLISDYSIRLDTCKERICQMLRKCHPNVALGIKNRWKVYKRERENLRDIEDTVAKRKEGSIGLRQYLIGERLGIFQDWCKTLFHSFKKTHEFQA